ncbi:MAG: peptidase inhibitor family I36 protein [Rhizobacter sp.]|nr:peptidase inhibitor family I36 protein [Burkholderiales bacterium]
MKFQKSRYRVCYAVLSIATLASPLAASAAELFLYSGRDFTGATARVNRSEGSLAIGAARSIRVETGVWEACTGPNFSGDCRRLTAGDYRELGDRYADTIQSVRDVTYAQPAVTYSPARLQVFEARDFRGRTNTIEQNVADFDQGRSPIGSPASAIVTGGTWEICTDYNFGGRCQALPPGRYNDLGAQLNYRIVSARVLDQPRPLPVPAPPPPPPVAVQVDPFAAIIGAIAGGVIANSGNNNPPAPYPPGAPGGRTRVDVYADVDFRGQALTLNDDVDNLRNSGLNDRIQSMRVSGGNWEACEDRNYGGSCMVFGPGDYRRLPPQMDQSISSIRRVGGGDPNWSGLTPGGQNYTMMDANAPRSRHPVWLYADSNFRGNTLRAVGDVADLGNSGMNDKASSIFISLGNWQFCEDSNYRGQCFILGPGQYSDVPQGMNDQISSFRRVR